MPKLGLGINLANGAGGKAPLTLYQDNFIYEGQGSYTFTTRQFFSNGTSSTVPTAVGFLKQNIGLSAHLIGYFDSASDVYPGYNIGKTYSLNEEIYGGIYGHGIFRKTSVGSPGFPPIMRMDASGGAQAGTQDANGWTRIAAPKRTLQSGQSLKISFDYRVDGTNQVVQNGLRFGVFGSVPYTPSAITYPYINNDYVSGQPTYINQGSASAIYGPYTGYSFNFGRNVSYGGIYRRIPNVSNTLISTTGGVYTQLQTGTASSLIAFGTTYPITLTFKRVGSSLNITSQLPNALITTTDTSPSNFSLDTLVLYAAPVSGTSYQISNIQIKFGNL